MNKSVAFAVLSTVTTVAAALTVQFPQYAVWFTVAGTLAGGLLKSPLFSERNPS